MSLTVKDLVDQFGFELVTGSDFLENEINDVYIGDLLSWVMGKAKENSAWITIQGHINIIAVAVLINCSCIIIAESAEISSDTIEKAKAENIPLFKTGHSEYEIARKFFEAGV
jgi:serine kinase of HPr protein (carbohydrate metabolism regulator)